MGKASELARMCKVLSVETRVEILELVKDRATKEPLTPWNGSSPVMAAFRKYCLDAGLYLYTHWHTVLVIPPLPITEAQLAEGFAVLDEALKITDEAVNI